MSNRVVITFDEASAVLRRLRSGGSWEKTVLVFPDTISAGNAQELLQQEEGVLDCSRFLTFQQLEMKIVRAGTGRKHSVLSKAALRVMAANILSGLSGEGRELSLFSDAISDEFDSIWPNLVDLQAKGKVRLKPWAGREQHYPAFSILKQFAGEYCSRIADLQDRGYCDRVTLALLATQHVEQLRTLGMESVFVFETIHADPVLLNFLSALAGVASLNLVFSPSDRGLRTVERTFSQLGGEVSATPHTDEVQPGRTALFGAPDRRRELREVARRILGEIKESGASPDEFAVVAPSINDYDADAREVFGEYGLAITGGSRVSLSELSHYSYLSRALEVFCGPPSKDKLLALIQHDLFPPQGTWHGFIAESAAHLPRDLSTGLPGTEIGDNVSIDGRPLWQWYADAAKKATGDHPLSCWISFSRELMASATGDSGGEDERRLSGKLADALQELSSDAPAIESVTGGRKYSLAGFREILDIFARERAYQSSRQGRGGVLFTDLGLLYFTRFRHVYALGMGEDAFPQKAREGVFTDPVLLEHLGRDGDYPKTSQTAIDSSALHQLNALLHAGRVTFSYVYSDERGRRRLPSAMVLGLIGKEAKKEDLLDMLEGHSLEFSAFYPEDGVAWSVQELGRIAAARFSAGGGLAPQPGPEFLEVLSRAEQANKDPNGWDIDRSMMEKEIAGRALSATDLSEYSKCPFRYVVRRVFRVNPRLPPLNPLDKGSQMHEVLRRFYKSRGLEFLRKSTDEEARAAVIHEAEAYFAELWKGRSLDFRFIMHRSDVYASLSEFVSRDRDAEKKLEGTITGLEQKFGYSDGQQFVIGGHRFRGVMDRVETIDQSGGTLLVYDYKSGNPEGITRKYFHAGSSLVDFGIPLYALYLSRVEGKRVGGAFYYTLSKADGAPDKAGIVERSWAGRLPGISERRRAYFSILDGAGVDEELKRFEHEIRIVADSITGCHFPVIPREGECTFCEFRSVCRFRGQMA